MKKFFLSLLFIFIFCPLLVLSEGFPLAILRGDYPDPTIIRDGKDYYMTHSPFVYTPGFLIWHSTDLVNWEPLVRTMTPISGSAYAPDLVKYDGKYYIYYPSAGTNWVIWADDIKGPWHGPIDLKVGGIDPGHIVGKDGKRYLFLSKGRRVELTKDGLKVKSEPVKVYDGWKYPKEWVTECFCLESPKLLYKDGYYYMTSAQGGTAGPATSHMVVSARAKNMDGPWENSPYNPIVRTWSVEEDWWSKGHGTLIDDVEGNWWIVYHAYEKGAHTLGRMTLIDPVKWTDDGWFIIDPSRKPLKANSDFEGMNLSDDFSSEKLGIQWTSWGHFRDDEILLKNGSLYLKGKGVSPGDGRLLLITVPDRNYQVQTEIELDSNSKGGLVLFYRDNAYAGIISDGETLTIYNHSKEVYSEPHHYGRHFYLKIINQKDICEIQASSDGVKWDTMKQYLDVSGLHHNNYRGFYALRAGLVAIGNTTVKFNNFEYTSGIIAPKPLYRDPVYDGAADPSLIWNPIEKKWWMFYTNRRATETHLPGVSWVFKTDIGIAESKDGANWKYVGVANFPDLPSEAGGDSATLWAPDVVFGEDGRWHMFLSIQAGIAEKWGVVPGSIDHFTSFNLRDWKYEARFELPIGCYDAEIIRMPDKMWRMYFKDPSHGASTFYYLESKDLYHWSDRKRVLSTKGEGPIIFNWEGYYWMILCDGLGFKTFRSLDCENWELQPGGPLLPEGVGTGKDDRTAGLHGDVIISQKGRAYLYYFTHPGRYGEGKNKDGYEQRRSSIQVVELKIDKEWLLANRNKPVLVDLGK